jgi:hypothetical protein
MSFLPPINPNRSLNDLKAQALTVIEDNATTARMAAGLGDMTGVHDALDRIVQAARQYTELTTSEANYLDALCKWLAKKLADVTGHPSSQDAA